MSKPTGDNIRGFQIRGARGLLNMSISRLAREAGITEQALKSAEDTVGPLDLPGHQVDDLLAVLDRYGVRLTREMSTRFGVRIDLGGRR